MISNRLMRELLERGPAVASTPPQLQYLFLGGFKDVEGCTFLRRLFRSDHLGAIELHHDLTGYEANVNKVFVEDYLEPDAARELPALAAIAVASARDLAERLSQARPSLAFKILVSASVTGSEKRPASATLRFHRVREHQRWIDPDLDGYEEAVAVVDTPSTR